MSLPRILIIDDDPRFLEMLVARVKSVRPNIEIDSYDDSTVACEEAVNNDYNMVMTDLLMPGLSGIEVIQYFHKNRPNLPIYAMSAYSSRDLVDKAKAMGVEVLDKFDLLASLERILDKVD